MSKTASIPDDAHTLILDKQRELKKKYKITVKISDLIAMYIKDSIRRTEKLLGLKSEEESDIKKGVVQDSTTDQNIDVLENAEIKT